MAAKLAIDEKLIEQACRLGQHGTRKEAVTAALEEYIQHHRQKRIFEAFGIVRF